MTKRKANKVQGVENAVVDEAMQVVNAVEAVEAVEAVANETSEKVGQVETPNTNTDAKEQAISAESLSFKDAKRLIIDEFNATFVTPFNVLNFVNKNRTKPAYKVVFEKFLIQDENGKARKMALTDLLSFTPKDEKGNPIKGAKDIFCRLSSVDKKGVSVSTFVDKDGKTWYFIPVPFSVNGFFSSVQGLFSYRKKVSALRAWEADADARAEHEKKQKAKLKNKVEELQKDETFSRMTEAQILLVARQITGVRVAL